MTRAIVILTIGRSGSSALAGALAQAKISFGPPGILVGPHRLYNPKGHFEHLHWHNVSQEIARRAQHGLKPDSIQLDELQRLLAQRLTEEGPIIGIKDVYSPWSLRFFGIWLTSMADWRMIVLRRGRDALIESHSRHYDNGAGCSKDEAKRLVAEALAHFNARVEQFAGVQQYHVSFETITDAPRAVFESLVPWCYDGIQRPIKPLHMNRYIGYATDWIDPELRHW